MTAPHAAATERDALPWHAPSPAPDEWSRVVLASVSPRIDGGRWPIQRSVGETVEVVAGLIVDGHEKIAAELQWRHEDDDDVHTAPLRLRYNDEYVGSFQVARLGRYRYKVRAWLDAFGTWQDQFRRRVEGGAEKAELDSELLDGASLLDRAAGNAADADRQRLLRYIDRFRTGDAGAALEDTVVQLARDNDPATGAVESDWLGVRVDPEHARFAAWYEFFPRSAADPDEDGEPVHGTLDDATERLARVKDLGFDVVYLPPVHPIGTTFRKGKDNAPTATPGEPGSPWAIGSPDGGHKAVAPELGGMEAFERFVAEADRLGLKVALDIAFQTSPDHPYVTEHPEWFRHRPDGTIRYAENPPKKYQDVYPFDFETDEWRALWDELKSVFEFWIDKGVRVFRVDNPHTKPFAFWEWCLGELREAHPDLVFLAEAFAKPKTMYTLAKLGYNNSYTYFTWRNTKDELREYGEELFQTEIAEFYRPNFWPNTPDILTEYLAHGGRPAHTVRFVLAATMSSAYGLYGPPFEHVDARQHPAREEYEDNEKYEVRSWDWDDPTSLQPLIKRVNRIRRENPALHHMRTLRFCDTDNPMLLAYWKEEPARAGAAESPAGANGSASGAASGEPRNLVLCVVNLDPYHRQAGWVSLPLDAWGMSYERPFEVHDLLGGERYYWQGGGAYVELDPHTLPAHVFRVERRAHTERDFPSFA
ncbi:alpha-1,4-glucan--maltose-1-phosphate maltosyltransferase [Rubrivirga marina]|uniref:Alpha-1,4-glucan:maltose-1-phosphate maltosyltransferase n=1 Tax=Rubrivirga marina TaxID=1196024 RepID=A0A271IV53_9BACT|nr:alpha-1,4-glucan--maltose-1-phosphate maltosyltransferase [Rubrivirga marina]PAP74990.1 alpha-1,4-glucan--maltose-1-phosphate maltosyltransferase [Rubrivirga marina]